MAGLTSIPFKPLISRPKHLSLSSVEPSLSKLRIFIPNIRSNSRPSRGPITARFGGGGSRPYFPRPSGGGGNRRPNPTIPSDEEKDDEALDLSTIKSDIVRLIDQNQKMVGIVSKTEAIQMAEDAELDLLIISPEADPPVVRIVDYNKHLYEIEKKKKDQLKKAAGHRRDQKELKMGYNIDVHDYTVRLKAAQRFLKDGDKVKVIVTLKGRQNEFKKNAIELLARFKDDLGELATEESRNFKDRNLSMVFIPNKVILQKELLKNKDGIVVEVSGSEELGEDVVIEVSGGEESTAVSSGPFHMLKQEISS